MADLPDIVVLFTDDQRFDTIAALGNTDIATPNIDSLCGDGTAFTDAYIMGGTAGAVCMPSRAMLMTGRSLFRLDDRGQRIPEDHTTLPEALRNAGYHTHHIGKWHQDRESFNRSFQSADRIFGFTKGWYEQYGGHWNVAVHDYDATATYAEDDGYMLAADGRTHVPIGPGAGGVHSSEMFADAAVEFIDSATKDEPFFLYLSFVAPHDPRQSPQEFEERYNPSDLPVPPNFMPRHPFDNGDLFVRDERLEGWPRRERAVQDHLADYYAMISHADAQIGRVVESLKRRGTYDNTIIVFAGDNGLAVGQHGLMGKQSVYEHSVGVPLIFCGPGVPKGAIKSGFCYLFDLFPTLCELIGIDRPGTVDGTSLVPLFKGETGRIRDEMYYGYQKWQRAFRSGEYKLIEYVVGDERNTQLFNIDDDPWETENLAGEPAYETRVSAMRERMIAASESYQDRRPGEGETFWSGF